MRYKDLWYQVVPTNKIVMNNIKSKWHINNKSHECSLVINKTYLKIYETYLQVIENTHYLWISKNRNYESYVIKLLHNGST